VRETFYKAVMLNAVVMVAVTVFLQWKPEILVGFFTAESEATEIGATFLRTISWTFIAQGVVFTCSGMFQGLGNTRPAMLSSAVRFVSIAMIASATANSADSVAASRRDGQARWRSRRVRPRSSSARSWTTTTSASTTIRRLIFD